MKETERDRQIDHPSDEALDRLRAGLVEDESTLHDLQRHVRACPSCRARSARWDAVGRVMRTGAVPHGTEAELRIRRRAVLESRRVRRLPSLLAAAAVVVVALGAVLWLSDRLSPSAGGDPALVADETSDLYTDIDFYLWLSQRDAGKGREERGTERNC